MKFCKLDGFRPYYITGIEIISKNVKVKVSRSYVFWVPLDQFVGRHINRDVSSTFDRNISRSLVDICRYVSGQTIKTNQLLADCHASHGKEKEVTSLLKLCYN